MRSSSSEPVVTLVFASQYQLPTWAMRWASVSSASFCRNASSARLCSADIVENDGDLPEFRVADAIGINVEPAIQGSGFVHETERFAGQRDFPVNLEPMGLMSRGQLAHPFSLGFMQPGLPLKSRVDLEEAVIDGLALRVENHLDDAKPFVHRVEQTAIPLFALAQRLPAPAQRHFAVVSGGLGSAAPVEFGDRAHEQAHAGEDRQPQAIDGRCDGELSDRRQNPVSRYKARRYVATTPGPKPANSATAITAG